MDKLISSCQECLLCSELAGWTGAVLLEEAQMLISSWHHGMTIPRITINSTLAISPESLNYLNLGIH